jgi:glycosyltransferase involved in cell wall biosynthesis
MSRVLIISREHFAQEMAGPAIRAWEIASNLSLYGHQVILASCEEFDRKATHFKTYTFQSEDITDLIKHCDVCVIQDANLLKYRAIQKANVPLVIDLYDPFTLENLELYKGFDIQFRKGVHRNDLKKLIDCVQAGDYFLCANERQRDFWLGFMAAQNRINPITYDSDPTGEGLIGIVPFGIPETPGATNKDPLIKGKIPGIEKNDYVLIWSGGIWDWFDPLTLIYSLKLLDNMGFNTRLLFLGYRHPNPSVPIMPMARAAKRLSDELGLTNRVVFFNEKWVPYDLRYAYLVESDLSVSTHLAHLESHFSFRTRLLDSVWADLPMVVTSGDTFAEWIESKRLGLSVPPSDPQALAQAIYRLLTDKALYEQSKENIRGFKSQLYWTNCIRPLAEFCKNPRFAGDGDRSDRLKNREHNYSNWYSLFLKARYRLKVEGVKGLWKGYLKWLQQK